jgi:carbon storage regulator
MLCLTREFDESVIIDLRAQGLGLITVTVLRLMGDKVRLGIAAPLVVPVHRKEIFDEIEMERLGDREERPS